MIDHRKDMSQDSLIVSFLSQLKEVLKDFAEHEKIIKKAINIAKEAHKDQYRKYDKTPFIGHPLQVALNCAIYQDRQLVVAAIMHDAVEDCEETSMKMVYNAFGEDIGFLVDAVSEEPLHFFLDEKVVFADKIEKILAGGMKDVRVLLLKLADRSHNLETLVGLKPAKQIRMAFETQAIYEPLKGLLCFDGNESISCFTGNMSAYLKEHNISSPSEFKKTLYSQMFDNFDHETYTLAYKNTDTIVWEVEDREWFEELMKNKRFREKTIIQSLSTDGELFVAKFMFKQGMVFVKGIGKMKATGFMQSN